MAGFSRFLRGAFRPEGSPRVLGCRVAYNAHGGYCVPLSSRHRPAARKILSGAVHEPETLEFIASHCGSGDVIHAGTYFGPFLPAVSRALSPGALLWAFEPNSENYECARITLLINRLDNVELVHAGLAERRDMRALEIAGHDGRASGGASRFLPERDDATGPGTERIGVVPIDGVIPEERRISMVHLDVEGYEQRALSGALATIRRCLPILVLEAVPPEAWLDANLRGLGYRTRRKLHANTVLAVE